MNLKIIKLTWSRESGIWKRKKIYPNNRL